MLIIVKSILVKSALSLFVGAASSIGMQAGLALWNNTVGKKLQEKEQKCYSN